MLAMSAPSPSYRATVAALALGQVVNWAALYYGFSSFVLPMQAELGWDRATLMGAFTLGLAVWGAATYAAGALVDAGRGRLLMSAGVAIAGLGFIGWSQVSAPWMLYIVWAVLGASMAATLYEPAFNILTKRYPERYQHGITMLTLVGGFASTLSFPAIAAMLPLLGWRPSLMVIGGVLLLGMTPLHLWALRGPALVASARPSDELDDATLHQALRQPAFWLLTLCFMLHAFVAAAMFAHVMPIFAAKGVSAADGLVVMMTVGPAQVAGRLVYVGFGRGWSLHRLGVVVMAGLPLGMALFAIGQSLPVLLAFALVFGMSNGLVTIVRGGLIPQIFGRTHVGRIGGAMSGIGLVARASAPVATAWLLLAVSGYTEVLAILAGLGVIAGLAFWRVKPAVPAEP